MKVIEIVGLVPKSNIAVFDYYSSSNELFSTTTRRERVRFEYNGPSTIITIIVRARYYLPYRIECALESDLRVTIIKTYDRVWAPENYHFWEDFPKNLVDLSDIDIIIS